MKRNWLNWLMAPVMVLALSACDVDVQDTGTPPDVDVEGGRAPDVDVTPPDVDVKTEKKEVDVPDIDVKTEKKQVDVPDVDINVPDENENEAVPNE